MATYPQKLVIPGLALAVFLALMAYCIHRTPTRAVFQPQENFLETMRGSSMNPTFTGGEICEFTPDFGNVTVGKIIAFQPKGANVPVTHRVWQVQRNDNGDVVLIVTKGDHNAITDVQAGLGYVDASNYMGTYVQTMPVRKAK